MWHKVSEGKLPKPLYDVFMWREGDTEGMWRLARRTGNIMLWIGYNVCGIWRRRDGKIESREVLFWAPIGSPAHGPEVSDEPDIR